MTAQAKSLDRLRAAWGSPRAAEVARFSECMGPLLAALRRYARRAMACLIARGDLDSDFPTSEDELARWVEHADADLRAAAPSITGTPGAGSRCGSTANSTHRMLAPCWRAISTRAARRGDASM